MKPTFENIIPVKNIPFWLFWIIVGLCSFVIGGALFRLSNENPFLVSLAIASFTMAFLPILNIWLSKAFRKLISDVSASIWDTSDRAAACSFSSYDFIAEIFTLKLPISKIVTSLIVVLGTATILFLGFPFRSTALNAIGLPVFLILLWFCGQTLYISYALLSALRKIVNQPIKVPFMLIPNPAIARLQRFYSLTSLSILFLYVLLVLAIWQGPYGLHRVLLIWLTLLAFYPGSMLAWSFFQIHNLLQKIKYSYIKIVNDQIQKALSAVERSGAVKDIERLDKLMKIQADVQRVNEWPIAVGGGVTFVITIITALTQIMVSVRQVFS